MRVVEKNLKSSPLLFQHEAASAPTFVRKVGLKVHSTLMVKVGATGECTARLHVRRAGKWACLLHSSCSCKPQTNAEDADSFHWLEHAERRQVVSFEWTHKHTHIHIQGLNQADMHEPSQRALSGTVEDHIMQLSVAIPATQHSAQGQ